MTRFHCCSNAFFFFFFQIGQNTPSTVPSCIFWFLIFVDAEQYEVEQKRRSFSLCVRAVQHIRCHPLNFQQGSWGGWEGWPAGLPLPINSTVFVTRCAARRRLSWHKERLCQICDMMLICVRCWGTHSLVHPPVSSGTLPPPFSTERSLVFRSRDDNRDRGRRRDGEAAGGYATTEEEIDLWRPWTSPSSADTGTSPNNSLFVVSQQIQAVSTDRQIFWRGCNNKEAVKRVSNTKFFLLKKKTNNNQKISTP